MKHIFKKLHKSYEPNRTTNEALTSSTTSTTSSSSSTAQPQSCVTSDQGSPAMVGNPPASPSITPPPSSAFAVPVSLSDAGNGGGRLGPDYFSSEEEFQMQLALAISASNSEFRDDSESDQIRAATLLSLEKSNSIDKGRDKEVSGEALSRRYWEYNILDYDEKIVDGFYDVLGLSTDPAVQRKMPALTELETSPGDSGFEAVIVNRTIDPVLVELDQVVRCIALDCPPGEISILVQRLAELVTDHMGGPVRDANIMLAKWMERSTELRTSLHTSVFPIGSLKLGLSRHRALLFKVLAENVGIRCRLVKGSHYTGVDDDAVDIIKLEDEREFLVDLMADPGTLIPADILSGQDSSSHYNAKLIPSKKTSNSSEGLYPRPKQLLVNDAGVSRDSEPENSMHHQRDSIVETTESFASSLSGSNNAAAAASSLATNKPTASQIDYTSTSAFGASLHKATRGNLAVGEGPRMNMNVVPYNQGSDSDSKDLFADLNPLHLRGAGRTSMQNYPNDYNINEAQRQRIDLVSARPLQPMAWKNLHAINEVPRKRDQDFVEWNSQSNHRKSDNYKRPSASSGLEIPENVSPSGLNSARSSYDFSLAKNGGHFQDVSPVAENGPNEKSPASGWGAIAQEEECQKDNQISSHEMFARLKTRDGFIGTSLLFNDFGGSSSLIASGSNAMEPFLDDVGECEIPWEHLVMGERIGLGSYGEVYHADWNGTEVAVKKFLDQDFSGDALAEFKREVRIMRRLRHPNVVLFMGAVTRPPNLSIVTEFLPRGSLYRIIHRPNCQIDENRRIKMALDVARGMLCLHTSTPTIVHRDLKSHNLLVDKNWNVKVCDFGLSRLKHNTFLSSKSTAGTPEWMAPEVLRNEPSNEKCDVYSFGIILWELATLRLPWTGMNPMQVVGAVGFQNQRLEIPKEVDPLVARIIWECWQTDPNLRPSFAQLCVALKPLQHLVVPSSFDHQTSAVL